MKIRTDRPDCTFPDRERLMRSYVAETLTADEAEAFEAHYFGCDECWREVQLGVEIRAAVPANSAVTEGPVTATRPARQLQWRWFAAAASVVLAVAVWRFSGAPAVPGQVPAQSTSDSPAPDSPVATPPQIAEQSRPAAPPRRAPSPTPAHSDLTLRSASSGRLRLTAARAPGGDITLTWPAVDKAFRYVLKVHASDGALVLTRETPTAGVVIDAATAARFPAGRLIAGVDAVNALGVTLVTSASFELRAR
jgi:hypothetical protein